MIGAQTFENIRIIRGRISHAAIRAGRRPEDIKLIAVTKTVGIQQIKEAIDSGLKIFGESKVQEAQKKVTSDELRVMNNGIEWHLIGHLQKNKTKTAVELFEMIHSIDSPELAEIIDEHAEKTGKTQKILLQVKLSDEVNKYGILKDNLFQVTKKISKMKNLSIKGLMTIPPFFENPENARPYFNELRALRDKAETMGFNLPDLSMGMTNDFEVAIEEGATMVRIGTAIFGERKNCPKEA
ncbi:MAG: YggS family pyridoxal phosphate-dependent enzyme [Nitrospirae bacterium]|nr:YggS family pyridoxal phosphate-dependent enzyme [Nitrospirota bacterium]